MSEQHPAPPGLTSTQVAERVTRGETNAYKARVGRTYTQIVRDNVLNLFNIVLFVLLVIMFLFEDYADIFFAGFSVVTNSILGMVQEIRAKRKMDALAALAAQDVPVYRDGKLTHIPTAEVVKDDIIPIEPGQRVIVDGRVLRSDALEMDESLLTGESDAVLKDEGDVLYSGSFCIAGVGLMVATQVGEFSTVNKLARVAKTYRNVLTPTQLKIVALVEIAVVGMLLFGPMIFVQGYYDQLTLLNTVRNAVVLVTSFVPQGLVLVATLSLTLGAISISRRQTLIQRVNAVESLANVTVLCFDKTGTLTRNQLMVNEVIPLNGYSSESITHALTGYTGNLAHMNKTAAAIAAYGGTQTSRTKIAEIPFNSARKWGAVVYDDETLILGAPERVLNAASGGSAAIEQARSLSTSGMRVLALARSDHAPEDGRLDDRREPLALIVMSDQVREDIRETLIAFERQNVRLKVISGDNPETVTAIAAQAGLKVTQIYTGEQLEHMSAAELDVAVTDANLFARVEPDTKRKIIAALKHQGHYVAMVGDGVNDVPPLKEADLAIVMNDGAQITKDVADIVLLNNAMSTLPLAFEEGRDITQKIYATAKLFLAKNFYGILLFIFIGFMTMPFPISPAQISWITFGTVNIPATLIAFSLIKPAHMTHFRKDVLNYVLACGVVGAASMALLYTITYLSSSNMDLARSAITVYIAFYGTLIFWNVHGVDFYQPRTLWQRRGITALGLVLTAVTIAVPMIQPEIFVFITPPPLIWLLLLSIFGLATMILGGAMRNNHVVNRLWQLSAP